MTPPPPRSLVTAPTTCRVSSVLDRNRTLYGAEHMLSEDLTTCWNSAQGSPQVIRLQFHRRVTVSQLQMMFQGGFVGQDVELRVQRVGESAWSELPAPNDVEPEDSNALQYFEVHAEDVCALQVAFGRSTDFYGRVIMYRLDVLGTEVEG